MAAARIVELVLVTPRGDVLGSLPPFEVATPWWPEARPIVRVARERYGIDVVVLRVLAAEQGTPPGGQVTYLAEVPDARSVERGTLGRPGLRPWRGVLADHPLRMPWARAGGPTADLEWAEGVLAARRLRRTAPPEQIRTWNLSSLWRIPIDGGTVWLKHVPSFFAHESAILERLAGPSVPRLIAGDGARSLLHEIPGEDMYDATLPDLSRGVGVLLGLQIAWAERLDELLALGLPDWRAPSLSVDIADVVERTRPELSAPDGAALDAFVDGLPDRFAAIADCGIPDTLVHGDFSPGNLRGDDDSLVLLDWGDSGVGHPLLDQPAMLERAPADAVEPLRDRWAAEWRAAIPRADPARAEILLAPIAAARQAVIYRRFLDGIEPSEWPYHRADPARWLGRTADLVRARRGKD